jgi:predicted nucleic acid-binding protein
MIDNRYFYLDSSVFLRIIWGQSAPAAQWYDQCMADGRVILSSRLLELEALRACRREHLDPIWAFDAVSSLPLLDIDNHLVSDAARIEPHIKALDALHLATAQRIGVTETVVVSHDATMKNVAQHLGFEVLDPVTI